MLWGLVGGRGGIVGLSLVGVDEEGLERRVWGMGCCRRGRVGESGESGVKGKDVEVLGGGPAEVVRAVDGAVARKVEGGREKGEGRGWIG